MFKLPPEQGICKCDRSYSVRIGKEAISLSSFFRRGREFVTAIALFPLISPSRIGNAIAASKERVWVGKLLQHPSVGFAPNHEHTVAWSIMHGFDPHGAQNFPRSTFSQHQYPELHPSSLAGAISPMPSRFSFISPALLRSASSACALPASLFPSCTAIAFSGAVSSVTTTNTAQTIPTTSRILFILCLPPLYRLLLSFL